MRLRMDALALALLASGTVVLLSYTLLDLDWQVRWGAWNYALGTGLTVAAGIPLRLWRPDPNSVPAYPPPGRDDAPGRDHAARPTSDDASAPR